MSVTHWWCLQQTMSLTHCFLVCVMPRTTCWKQKTPNTTSVSCHMKTVCCTTICVLVHKPELNLKWFASVRVTNACLGGRGSAECSGLTNAYGSLPEVCTLSGLGVWQSHICFDKLRFNLWSANNQFRSSSISSSDLHIIYQDLLDITN